jgi:hypothetical protein
MMHIFMQAWAGKLGAGPQPGSLLAEDRAAESDFATERLTIPIGQAWTFAQTLGQAATNHEEILRESLQRNANGDGARPIGAVETRTRMIVELLAVQLWLTDADLISRQRVGRWLALEREAVRQQWRMTYPSQEHSLNTALQALDADVHGLNPELPKVPSSTDLAGRLFERVTRYVPTATTTTAVGELMYRLSSGSVHGDVAHLIGALLPTGEMHEERPVVTYSLSAGSLWRATTVNFLALLVARCNYADWLGLEVPADMRALSLHHIQFAADRLGR